MGVSAECVRRTCNSALNVRVIRCGCRPTCGLAPTVFYKIRDCERQSAPPAPRPALCGLAAHARARVGRAGVLTPAAHVDCASLRTPPTRRRSRAHLARLERRDALRHRRERLPAKPSPLSVCCLPEGALHSAIGRLSPDASS